MSKLTLCRIESGLKSVLTLLLPSIHFNRGYTSDLLRLAAHFPALVVTGARQTGKSTLLKTVFPNHRYVTLDVPSLAALADENPEAFLQQYPPPVVIDAVQYAPGLFRHLKLAIDQNRHVPGQFILSGSQKFVLMKGVSDSLAGRTGLLELEGLSFEEIAQHNPYPERIAPLIHAIARGTMPELWRVPELSSDDFFRGYLAAYLERDVRQILNVGSLRNFERFIRVCATRTAQTLDRTAIARDVGVSVMTIGEWVSVLEASNQIQLLEPYFANLGKRLVKTPKLYLSDTGLLCYLLGLDDVTLPQSPYLGAVWETAVYAQLRKLREGKGSKTTLNFYRDAQQREVDFVMSSGGDRLLLEVKWSENPTAHDAQALKKVAAILDENDVATSVRSAIVCRTPQASMLGPDIELCSLKQMPSLLRLPSNDAVQM